MSGLVSGGLSVLPEKLHADDQDTLRTPVRYSFASGVPPEYGRHFSIDADTGVVTQVAAVDRADAERFEITVKVI